MKLSVSDELRGNRLSLIKAVILSSSGVPAMVTMKTLNSKSDATMTIYTVIMCFSPKLLVLDIPLGKGMVLFSGAEGGTRP